MNISDMVVQNPWWKEKKAIGEDRYIEGYNLSVKKWTPRIKFEFEMEKDVIHTMRGPRQVGKTTLVKLIIKDLLERYEPARIFYWTCDLVSNSEQLASVISDYIDWARSQTSYRLYIFLDEISSVAGWQKSIKYLVDIGKLKNATLILTGSHAIDIKKSGERLPGRRGSSKKPLNKILMPMKFSEYVETVDKNFFDKIGIKQRDLRHEIIFDAIKGKVNPFIRKIEVHLKDINHLLDSYLLTGGFPRTVNEFFSAKSIRPETYSIYLQWVLGDMAKWGKDERKIKQIIRRLIETYCSQVSWYSITSHTDIGSHNTVSNYAESLEESFVLNIVNKIELSKKLASYRSEKKIYFSDPFIFHTLNSWVFGFQRPFETSFDFLSKPENKSKLVEGVVYNHLVRLAYNLYPSDSFLPEDYVFFLKKRHEIDFILKHKNMIPFEVKYKSAFDRKDITGMSKFRHGMVLSKDTISVEKDYTVMPAGIFMLLV